MGRIHKQGPKTLRWILTTCVHAAVKNPGKFQHLFRCLERRIRKGKVIVAVPHRMLEVIFALLARHEVYSGVRAEKTRLKLARMRSKARALRRRDPRARWTALGEPTRRILTGARG